MTPAKVPDDVRTVASRHVALHARQARHDLEKALAPLQQSKRGEWARGPLADALRNALTHARTAERLADRWRDDVHQEQGLL